MAILLLVAQVCPTPTPSHTCVPRAASLRRLVVAERAVATRPKLFQQQHDQQCPQSLLPPPAAVPALLLSVAAYTALWAAAWVLWLCHLDLCWWFAGSRYRSCSLLCVAGA